VVLTLGCSGMALVASVSPAMAAVFSNPAPITMPDPNCTDPDIAMPYPSNIAVSGMTGTVSDVNVTLNGVTHPFEGDVEILLVSPAGGTKNLTLLSDAGTGALSNATVTFDDSAASLAPQNSAWAPGTYKPSNYTELSGADTFPAPAPAPSSNTTLGAAFDGINPNGTWSLYVVDDACPDAGSISGGWSLNITSLAAAATSTSIGSSLNPSRTGQSVTFTATVTSGGSPVTTGAVRFEDGATVLAASVAVNGSGVATFTTSSLTEGNHLVKATYIGNATFATSNATVNQRVDNNSTQTGSTYCNTGAVTITDNGPSTPYPSNIFISGAPPSVIGVTATLKNVSHGFDGDIEAMLVGPAGQNLVVVSDAGTAAVSNVTVNLADAAAGTLPAAGSWAAPNSTITVKPTNYNELTADTFPAPAPAPSAATTLSTFNTTNPNGTWSLYVNDDGAPDSGSIAGGWCLNFTFDTTPPTVTINQAGGQVDPASAAPVNYTVVFSEPVTGFDNNNDVSIAGTAGGTKTALVTGSGTTYNVAVSGMTTSGTVIVTVPAGRAADASGNVNTASTSTDNTVTWAPDRRHVPADFDGNGTTDISVFRPGASAGWFIRNQTGAFFGTTGDLPVPGDYDGNGTTDIAVFRPGVNAGWYIRGQVGSFFGTTGDIPVPGDYDGNGTTDIAVFRPSQGGWFIKGQAGAFWGTTGDIPVPADYDGNGTTDIAVFRPGPSAGWYIKGGTSSFWGTTGDIPVPGDYDGNGTTDLAVYRPGANGAWFVKGQAGAYFGTTGDIPVPGKYDANAITDIAIYRPGAAAGWFIRNQAGASFGTTGDIPLPLPYAIRSVFFP
jgi:subtilisin-like proprotein convertase family protein